MNKHFHIPTRPFSPIDTLNRRAAAVGSPGYAAAASHADYNGHHITVSWNDYRGYYITEYWWAGRNVLCRGTFEECLRTAIAEHNRGALGSYVSVFLRADDTEAEALCKATPELKEGAEDKCEWLTWRHRCAAESVRDYANPGMLRTIFDWELMQEANSEKEYYEALKAKYGRTFW